MTEQRLEYDRSSEPARSATHKPVTVDLTHPTVPVFSADVAFGRERGLYERFLKPALDLLLSLILLILTLPLMAICAVAVYIEMGRPILLKQPRVGRFGRVFTLYKFRTMIPDRRESSVPFLGVDRRVTHKTPHDPRITRVGAFLRKWSLDELPQFLNVLKLDMSLVGPRPELVDIVARYEPWQHKRHAVKPGITGIWQTSKRGEALLHECTEVDLEYLDRLGMFTDVAIMIWTIPAALGLRRGY